MKIRYGFVSNSSSTSFCVIGKPIPENDIFEGKYKRKPGEIIILIGGYTDDGDMVTDIDDEQLKILASSIEKPSCAGKVTFVGQASFYEGGENLREFPKGSKVYCGSCTINGLDSLEEFEKTYVRGKGDWVQF